jgi:hypothetical protein
VIHDNALSAIDTNITSLENTKQDVIDIDNLLSSSLVQTGVSTTLDTTISTIMTDIDGKQDTITSGAKLSSDLVDYSTSTLRFVDISGNLQTQLTDLTNAISTLQSLQEGDVTSFQTIQDNFDTLDTLVTGKQDTIDSSHKLASSNVDYSASALRFVDITSSLQSQLDGISSGGYASISYDAPTTTTTISDNLAITTLLFGTDEQTTAFTDAKDVMLQDHDMAITALQSSDTTQSTAISSLTSALSGKQNTLSNATYLAYVDSGLTQNISTSLGSFTQTALDLKATLQLQHLQITFKPREYLKH